ncbi:acyl-CoA dehydrogenase [Desulfosarcina alkanivorans]|uniref:Acyl-CoA dehydrogenase n=1 Tax=Desulfosarcina alkanivorans TaxID=571177 RepID=A0A5K7YHV1_9BACT|nr:acyl-CoA dehydrogenase family protein [Desulfosarcina alkanivorans]BBO67995.1 acyl-CoA dehydrogenase [Desulfosarcina alkanivorans]
MDVLQYTQAHLQFRERTRNFFANEVTPFVEQWEKEKMVPRDIWRRMGREGLLCTTVPERYQGPGHDFLHAVIVNEELSRTNHYGLMAPLHSDIIAPYIATFGSEEQKQKYLPGCVSGDIVLALAMTEPDVGSDVAAMTATAVEEGDEIVIDGAKTFISNGIHCDLVIVAAKDPAVEPPHAAVSLYLVEDGTPGFNKGNKLDKMGMYSQDTAELFFSGCRIPKDNLLGAKGQGFRMLMQKLQQERLVCSIMAVATAEQVCRQVISHCKTNSVSDKPISKSQSIQFKLAEIATEVQLGRAFLDKLIADHMEGKEINTQTSMAKYWTCEMVNRVLRESLDILGMEAATEQCPLVRTFRDSRVMSIFAGTSEIMKVIVAKNLGL